jgi:hypothetical protein
MYKTTKVGIIHEIAPTRQKSGLWPLDLIVPARTNQQFAPKELDK